MNCPNCGGAMDLVDARRSFRCAYCGTIQFLDPPEAMDGVRVLGRTANAPSCPICGVQMSNALLDDRHPVVFCEACRGVLLPRQRFAQVVHEKRAWATGPPEPPSPIDAREFERHVLCPHCSKPMATHPYFGPGSVVIDSCDACDLVWLDLGELKQIADAPGADRGRGNVVRRRS